MLLQDMDNLEKLMGSEWSDSMQSIISNTLKEEMQQARSASSYKRLGDVEKAYPSKDFHLYRDLYLFICLGTSGSEKVKKRIKKGNKPWSKEEKEAVFRHLKKFINEKRLPGKLDCLQCIQKSSPVLDSREWQKSSIMSKMSSPGPKN